MTVSVIYKKNQIFIEYNVPLLHIHGNDSLPIRFLQFFLKYNQNNIIVTPSYICYVVQN
jgi:hypothetical protein